MLYKVKEYSLLSLTTRIKVVTNDTWGTFYTFIMFRLHSKHSKLVKTDNKKGTLAYYVII